jgi:hypothetical protein
VAIIGIRKWCATDDQVSNLLKGGVFVAKAFCETLSLYGFPYSPARMKKRIFCKIIEKKAFIGEGFFLQSGSGEGLP